MEATYELTQKDFFDSFVAHRSRSLATRWFWRFTTALICFLLAAGLLGVAARPSFQTLSDLARVMVFPILWAAIVWVIPWWTASNQFSKQPKAPGPRKMTADANGIRWDWEGGCANVEWKGFTRWLECKSEILVYTSPACFNIVPTRALTPEQLSEFRGLLTQKLKKGRA
jgi:YcxB-like protein